MAYQAQDRITEICQEYNDLVADIQPFEWSPTNCFPRVTRLQHTAHNYIIAHAQSVSGRITLLQHAVKTSETLPVELVMPYDFQKTLTHLSTPSYTTRFVLTALHPYIEGLLSGLRDHAKRRHIEVCKAITDGSAFDEARGV